MFCLLLLKQEDMFQVIVQMQRCRKQDDADVSTASSTQCRLVGRTGSCSFVDRQLQISNGIDDECLKF